MKKCLCHKKLREGRGYSLVETLIALTLFVLMMAGFSTVMASASAFSIRAKEIQQEYESACASLEASGGTASTETLVVQGDVSASKSVQMRTTAGGVLLQVFE